MTRRRLHAERHPFDLLVCKLRPADRAAARLGAQLELRLERRVVPFCYELVVRVRLVGQGSSDWRYVGLYRRSAVPRALLDEAGRRAWLAQHVDVLDFAKHPTLLDSLEAVL